MLAAHVSAVCKRVGFHEPVEQGQELDTGGDGMATWIQDQVSSSYHGYHWFDAVSLAELCGQVSHKEFLSWLRQGSDRAQALTKTTL